MTSETPFSPLLAESWMREHDGIKVPIWRLPTLVLEFIECDQHPEVLAVRAERLPHPEEGPPEGPGGQQEALSDPSLITLRGLPDARQTAQDTRSAWQRRVEQCVTVAESPLECGAMQRHRVGLAGVDPAEWKGGAR